MSLTSLLDSLGAGAACVSSGRRVGFGALLLLAALGGCADPADGGGFDSPDGGWQVTADGGGTYGGGTTAGLTAGGGGLSGSGSVGGTGAGVFGGNISGTAAGGSTAAAGGSLSGTAGGSLSGTAGGTLSGTGTAAGGSGGLIAGLAAGGSGGLISGLAAGGSGGTGGVIGGLFGGLAGGGSTVPATPLDPSVKKPADSKLPKVNGACPNLVTGSVSIGTSTAQIWVGSKPGPVYFYWHGTGSDPGEVDVGLPGATDGVLANGGLVASWENSNEMGDSTGSVWTVWFTGDFDAADQILACAIQKGIVDTGRIHTAGYSAGGLQSGAMLWMRSNYIASGIIYSGAKGFGAAGLQDPSNAPAVLGAHGAQGDDWLILDFHDGTIDAENEMKSLGGFAMDCDDGAGHIDFFTVRAGVGNMAVKFLTDHPYNTKPSPYANGLPPGYPSYCKVVK